MDEMNVKDMLFAYVNEELTDKEKQQVEDWCRTDSTIAAELELTRATMRLIENRAPAGLKPDFWDNLSDRIDDEEAARHAWVWTAKRLIPAMVAATLIISVLLSSSPENGPSTEMGYDAAILAYDNDRNDSEDIGNITDATILESVFFTTE